MDLPEALQQAITHHKAGELKDAERLYRFILNEQANHPDANHNLGMLLKQGDQVGIALPFFKTALESNPNQGQFWVSYIDTLIHLGQLNVARSVLEQGQSKGLKGDVVDQLVARLNSKVGSCLEPIKKQSTPTQDQIDSVIALYSQGQIQKALNASEVLIKDYPNSSRLYNINGACYQALGQLNTAVKRYEQALAIKPDYAEVHNNLGVILQELGQLNAAVMNCEQALTIKPDYAMAHKNLSTMKQYVADDSQITQMQMLLSTDELRSSDRMHLCFALAKAYEDLGKHDELFQVLHEGNQLRKQDSNYSLDQDKNLHSILRKVFSLSSSINEQSAPFEAEIVQPIFIVGMPRSGTSLVEQIIASHHAVHGGGELEYLADIVTQIINSDFTHNPSGLPKETSQSLRQHYLDSLARLNVSENIITDKMPLNFQFIGFILSAFPEAKIIHLKRDARATCWSIYKHYFSSKGMGFSYNQNDLASFYHLYTDLMAFWHQKFPDKIYDLCYEDLTTNQEEETRNLLKYCELEWDENCLNFHLTKRAVKTTSAFQVRQKMYQGSSEAWRKYEEYLQPLMNGLSL